MVLSNDLVLGWRVHYHRAFVPEIGNARAVSPFHKLSLTLLSPCTFFPNIFLSLQALKTQGGKKMKCVDMVYMIHTVLQRVG